ILPDATSSLCLPIQVGQTAANIAWTTPTAQWVLRQIQMKKPKMTMQAHITMTSDEPNVCAPGEDVTEYAALGSDGESQKMSVIDDDEKLGDDGADDMVEDGGVIPDMQLDPSLVEVGGGLGAIHRGSAHPGILKDMKLNG
ncbi:hypothetical protein PF004_g31657, partial [Phytophthora fragariae]